MDRIVDNSHNYCCGCFEWDLFFSGRLPINKESVRFYKERYLIHLDMSCCQTLSKIYPACQNRMSGSTYAYLACYFKPYVY